MQLVLLFVAVQFFNLHPLLNMLAFGVAATESVRLVTGPYYTGDTWASLAVLPACLSLGGLVGTFIVAGALPVVFELRSCS